MEALDHKLKSGYSVVVAQVISKLIDNINHSKNKDIEDLPEYKFLKEKCLEVDPLVSKTASNALIILVQDNSSKVHSILADFIARISHLKCFSNLVYLINNLLLIDLKNQLKKNGSYINHYNLRLPQHPFITILNENSSAWIYMFEEITSTMKMSSNEPRLTQYVLNLYKPLFLYITCNPDETSFPVFKYKLWSLLLNHSAIVEEVLNWIQLESEQNIVVNSELLNGLIKSDFIVNICELDVYITWEVSVLNKLITYNLNPLQTISIIEDIIHSKGGSLTHLNAVLLMLSRTILNCPVTYLLELISLCKLIIEKNVDNLALEVLKPFLLQWIANKTTLSEKATKVAQDIFFRSEPVVHPRESSTDAVDVRRMNKMMRTSGEAYLAVKIWHVLDSWSSIESVWQFLDKLERIPAFFLTEFTHVLFMIFNNDFGDTKVAVKSLKLLLKCGSLNRTLSTSILTLILFKLSNTIEPDLHHVLLDTLPKMGAQNENVKKISNTILALSKGPMHLKIHSLKLMFELWKNNEKCYPHLENLLVSNLETSLEIMTTKAYILKEICLRKPQLYGRDMVAHLSRILNECNSETGAIPSALAIEGISYLCREGVIDIITTWATLAPKFQNETRIPVVKSICILFATIPTLSYVEAYPQVIKDIVSKLWSYIIPNSDSIITDPEVMTSALDALSNFSIEQISLAFPQKYVETVKENSSDSNDSVSAPGWLNLLKDSQPVPVELIGDFLIKIVSREVSGYLKYVYQTKKGNAEPTSYSYLPANSCVRSIGKFLKNEVLSWEGTNHEKVYLECLRIFSRKYTKPLPPLDWCFLQELIHNPQAKKYSITIASKQVILSGTARRLIENYLVALTVTQEDIVGVRHVYENLQNIGNSIQPGLFHPFIEATFNYALNLYINGKHEEVLTAIIDCLFQFLKNSDVQETNKTVIADVIKKVVYNLTADDQVFKLLLDIMAAFPANSLNSISLPKSQDELSPEWMTKAVIIRCEVAKASMNLNMLNELINCDYILCMEEQFVFRCLASVFEHNVSRTEPALWLGEFIDQVQFQVADRSLRDILFKCKILMLTVIVFSGHQIFIDQEDYSLEKLLDLFPRAAATLFDSSHWSICVKQAMDWFYHMNMETFLPPPYIEAFGEALQALRHEDEFKKNMRWMKYLNAKSNVV